MGQFNKAIILLGRKRLIILIVCSFTFIISPTSGKITTLQSQTSGNAFQDLHTQYQESSPIYIINNANFSATAGLNTWDGDGTSLNPYKITGLNITGPQGKNLIEIKDTTVYFQISNCILSGGLNGVYLINVTQSNVSNNIIYDNIGDGIALQASQGNFISTNSIYGNTLRGIHLESNSIDNIITDNMLTNNEESGVRFDSSPNNFISKNIIEENQFLGIDLDSSSGISIVNNIVVNNTQNGFRLSASPDAIITGNNVSYNSKRGIDLQDSGNCTISDNIIFDNHGYAGIGLSASSLCVISGNNISNNDFYGIRIVSSGTGTFFGNTFSYNEQYGVWFDFLSKNNTISWNNFIENNPEGSFQSFDSNADQSLKNKFTKNYWSEWTSPDANTDGVVDESYLVEGSANNQDAFPLVSPLQFVDHPLSISTVHYPNGGESISGSATIQWIPSIDYYGHNITYTVYYSSDGGVNWVLIPNSSSLTKSNYEWDTTTVANGSKYVVKVVAECSEGLEAEDSSDSTFSIQNLVSNTTTITNTTTTGPAGGLIPGFTIVSLFVLLSILGFQKKFLSKKNKKKSF